MIKNDGFKFFFYGFVIAALVTIGYKLSVISDQLNNMKNGGAIIDIGTIEPSIDTSYWIGSDSIYRMQEADSVTMTTIYN